MRHTPSPYKETVIRFGSAKVTFQLAPLTPDADRARSVVLASIVRYLTTDPVVVALLAEDQDKRSAFLLGLGEVVAGRVEPGWWTAAPEEEIAAFLLREGARRGQAALYLCSGRGQLTADADYLGAA